MSKSVEQVNEALKASGLSVEELRMALSAAELEKKEDADDPYVASLNCCIPRQAGCPVRERKVKRSELDALSWEEKNKLRALLAEPDFHLDVASHHWEDVRRALKAH